MHNTILTEPPQVPGVRRLVLSEVTSKFLQSTGEHAFVIVGKLFYPAKPGAWAIFLEPVPIELAHLANGVLSGTHRAVKIKQPNVSNAAASDRLPANELRIDAKPSQARSGVYDSHTVSKLPQVKYHLPMPSPAATYPPPGVKESVRRGDKG